MADANGPAAQEQVPRGTDVAAIVQRLREQGLDAAEATRLLAGAALDEVEREPAQASTWIEAASHFEASVEEPLLDYARARLLVLQGNLGDAETALRRAQAGWRLHGDVEGLARSLLGITQMLAMQGRHAEADASVRTAIAELEAIARPDAPGAMILLAGAHHNLGTLQLVQDRHAPALAAYDAARAVLERIDGVGGEIAAEIDLEMAHNAFSRATSLTFLDRPGEADEALADAIARFDRLDQTQNRGRARTNLARLRARLGDYAGALVLFEEATLDLLGVPSADDAGDEAELRIADELLLEQGLALLALNLIPEATDALQKAERLFAQSKQPYERAQCLHALAIAAMRGDAITSASAPLDEAMRIFEELGNRYWSVRTRVDRARLEALLGNAATAAAILDGILAEASVQSEDALLWDLPTRLDALLLRAQLRLDAGQTEQASFLVQEAAHRSRTPLDGAPPASPHFAIRVLHMAGRVARTQGDLERARAFLSRAAGLLDQQRALLPLEEARTSFIEDKTALYEDLLLALLDAPQPGADFVAAAFDVVERARSRALLERLLAAVSEAEGAATPEEAEVRRRLHWLYNQVLGEEGNRGLDARLTQTLRDEEARLQRLNLRASPLRAQAESASLSDFQSTLEADQQALVFAVAGDELLGFVVSRQTILLKRNLCSVQELDAALAELRYQLGRVSLGADYLARYADRVDPALRAALHVVYRLVFAPLAGDLRGERLLILPAGPLHGVPFHALWTGSGYLLEEYEIALAPSATIAIHLANGETRAMGAWAGLAIRDAAIPSALEEVHSIATRFPDAALFVDDEASLAGLRSAAHANVLHIATHGLFRADNPYFSVLKLADGWVDVRQLYRLPLRAWLVVLSACESGAGQARAGDEVIGLARGFLAAGARSIVASIWSIHDQSAALLMDDFYAALLENGNQRRPAAALRAAQTAAIHAGVSPFLWGPFYAIGQ